MNAGIVVWIIIALLLLMIFVWLFVKVLGNRSTHNCPHCESTDVVEIGRQTMGTDTVEQHGGGYGGGGDIRVRTKEEINYRCNSCQQSSTVTVQRTN